VRGLDGKVAVVTGGGNGIGRACCLRLADEGAHVLVADILEDHGAKTVAEIEAMGRRGAFARVDTSNPADNDAMVATAVKELGGVDVLVTAAGISHQGYRSDESGENDPALSRLEERAAVGAARQFVDTPLEEAERRDPKGLYRKAREGQIKHFTGIDSAYERPEAPEVHVQTAKLSTEDAVELVLRSMRNAGKLDSIRPPPSR